MWGEEGGGVDMALYHLGPESLERHCMALKVSDTKSTLRWGEV